MNLLNGLGPEQLVEQPSDRKRSIFWIPLIELRRGVGIVFEGSNNISPRIRTSPVKTRGIG
jgi:hypothetical protein